LCDAMASHQDGGENLGRRSGSRKTTRGLAGRIKRFSN
jgi:hypothetical protein